MNRSLHPVEQEEVMTYLDGELPAERAAEVATHLEGCHDCAAIAAALRSVSQQMLAWTVDSAPAELSEAVTNAAREAIRTRKQPSWTEPRWGRREFAHPTWRRWAAIAGVAACALVALWTLNSYRSLRSQEVERATGLSAPKSRVLSGPSSVQGDFPSPQPPPPEARTRGALGAQVGSVEKELREGPMIARTASLVIVVKDFGVARPGVERIVQQHQGYIAELTTANPQDAARTLTASLRIPATQLDSALAKLKALGRVEQESQAAEEVTKQYMDLVARLKNSRTTEQRLVDILRQRPGKVSEVLEVEQEIARVREEIEQMEAERKGLEKRVEFATVQLQLREEYKAQLQMTRPSAGTQLRNAVVSGYREAADSVLDLVLFVLEHGPALLLWAAVLFWPARFAWRRLKSRFHREPAIGA